MKKLPLIGVTCDYSTKQTYSKFPWYALRENYISSITKQGAMVVPLHYESKDFVEETVNSLDGLIVTGGDFDISPEFYGQSSKHEKTSLNLKRTENEFEILTHAVKRDIPILGICGGMQLINVFFKGTLMQHIDDCIKTDIKHEQPNPRNEAGHSIKVEKNTKLFNIIKEEKAEVNSAHHQAVSTLGQDIKASAYAEDGIIEAIEHEKLKFCLAVQYHPEFEISSADTLLLQSFVNACKE